MIVHLLSYLWLAVAILPDDAAAEALPPAAAECVPLEDAIVIDEHVIFSRVFQAAQIPLNATDRYTIFVPEDGEIVSPGSSGGIAGMYGFAGLFSAYGIDTRSARTIRSAPHFSQIKGFVPYYIVRGAYSLEQLRSRSSSNHLTTMFDTGSITCTDPSDKESTAPSDGDIKIEQVNGVVGLTDDSTKTTVQATIVKGDVIACGGSYVHLIHGVLNPCCNDRNADCTTAPFDPQQIDTALEASAAAGLGTAAQRLWRVAVAAAGAAWVAALAL